MKIKRYPISQDIQNRVEMLIAGMDKAYKFKIKRRLLRAFKECMRIEEQSKQTQVVCWYHWNLTE